MMMYVYQISGIGGLSDGAYAIDEIAEKLIPVESIDGVYERISGSDGETIDIAGLGIGTLGSSIGSFTPTIMEEEATPDALDPYQNINNPQLEKDPHFTETKLCEACGHICHHHCGSCPECDCEECVGSDHYHPNE